MKRIPEILARFVERRPWLFVIIVVLLSVLAVPGITMSRTESGFSTLVSPESDVSRNNARYEEQFGSEPITVLLSGELDDIFSSDNLIVLSEFEREFAQDERFRAILSPVTVLDLAVEEAESSREMLEAELARAVEDAVRQATAAALAQGLGPAEQELVVEMAKSQVLEQFQSQLGEMQQVGEPSLANPAFVDAVLYSPDGSINPALEFLAPDDGHALIIVTPAGNMDDEVALQAAEDIEQFFVTRPLANVDVTVIGDAKIIAAITDSIGSNMAMLLGLAIGVMFIILIFMFRVRWRLLSLLMVGIGALWTFGLMGYGSVPLSMATMAVLPVLVGLGIDYSIQFHNRYQEEVTRSGSVAEAIITSLKIMFPVVGVALLATVIGFITLYISEVPMVQDFGLMLAIGAIFCYLVGLFLLYSIVYLGDRKTPIARLKSASIEAGGRIERILARIARFVVKKPLPIFLIALIVGIAGGVVDHWLPTNTDYEELMPQDIVALEETRELRDILDSGGEIRFMVEAADVTQPEVLSWMQAYGDTELALYPEIISVSSPATLVSAAADGVIPDTGQVDRILESAPSTFVERVVSADRTMASLSFNIKYISLQQTHDLIQVMQQDARVPDGVSIAPVGSLALGSGTVDAISGKRLLMNIICLSAIFLVLLIVYRRLTRAVFAIITAGMVIAWSSLDMYLIGIPLNPLTSILGVIIIGIGTEFMVLLLGRYEEEMRRGESPRDAMVTAISRIGRAIVTTALTTLGGFGVLIASNFVMIRDFGLATVIAVFLCLISTILVMPPLIVWFDERVLQRSKDSSEVCL